MTNEEKTANKATVERERKRYLDHEIDHQAYYLWLADFIGVPDSVIPVTPEEVQASTDPHLNDIPLGWWDRKDPVVRHYAYAKGLPWSLSDTVCVLKSLARRRQQAATV